ncbi:MAG: thiamine diphosphokinase [Litoreibacter sp.]|nr:thiamine diphosphokinase [Litoreibacter sp.]MCY4335394.1 thiamine diphosphokinase [Litoreibacter sp.]
MAIIVHTPTFLTLLGGAPTHFSHVKQALTLAPILVAADGGATLAVANGIIPDAVIGDLDSLTQAARAAIPAARIHHIAEQDSTDFDKCLDRIEARAILALGFSGGRLDHQLAACSSLVKFTDKTVFLISEEDVCFVCPSQLDLDLPEGTRFSIYPMSEMRGTSAGLAYPIDGLTLSPTGIVGTSNAVTGPVSLKVAQGEALVIVPRDCLEAVLAQMVGAQK